MSSAAKTIHAVRADAGSLYRRGQGNRVLWCVRCPASAGVAMDDLVYICTKIARQMDAQGLDRIFDAAEAAAAVAEEATAPSAARCGACG